MQEQSTEPLVGYFDFMELCRVNEWDQDENLEVREDGVYVKVPTDESRRLLLKEEYETLTRHPTGDPREPALRFCCNLAELQGFLESQGFYGCIDAFDMARWALRKTQVSTGGAASGPKAPDLQSHQTKDKPFDPRERKSLLTIIAALCDIAKVDLTSHYKSAHAIVHLLELKGAPMKVDTIAHKLEAAREMSRDWATE